MNYQSVALTASYTQWMIAIAGAVITVRCLYIIVSMSNSTDEGVSMSSIWKKVANHVKALVIFVIIESVISLLKGYFFH